MSFTELPTGWTAAIMPPGGECMFIYHSDVQIGGRWYSRTDVELRDERGNRTGGYVRFVDASLLRY